LAKQTGRLASSSRAAAASGAKYSRAAGSAVSGCRLPADRARRERARPGIAHVAQAHMQADGRRLVDHQQALPVGVIEDFFRVRVVGRPERVGADPPQQREVADHPRVVMALAVQHAVLVHAEAAEPDRLPVEQQPGPVHADGPDAHRQGVLVVAVPGVQAVQMWVGGAPRPGGGHGQDTVRAAALGHDRPGRVPQQD
jgi:hypothetical protein